MQRPNGTCQVPESIELHIFIKAVACLAKASIASTAKEARILSSTHLERIKLISRYLRVSCINISFLLLLKLDPLYVQEQGQKNSNQEVPTSPVVGRSLSGERTHLGFSTQLLVLPSTYTYHQVRLDCPLKFCPLCRVP